MNTLSRLWVHLLTLNHILLILRHSKEKPPSQNVFFPRRWLELAERADGLLGSRGSDVMDGELHALCNISWWALPSC